MRTGAAHNLIVNNICYENGDHGIYVQAAPGQHIISNSIYKNASFGINIERPSIFCALSNNISVDDSKGNIRITQESIPGITMDFDQFFQSKPGLMIVWGMDKYC